MLTRRIIPCLDVTDGRVVKGVNFVNLRDAGDPVELAAFYNEQGADEVGYHTIDVEPDDVMVGLLRHGWLVRRLLVEDRLAVLHVGSEQLHEGHLIPRTGGPS